ncbi:MAG: hypothetical protein WKI04_01155 [Ferruginibacter sp.]
MKQKLTTLIVLFITMSVLTSSRQDCVVSKDCKPVSNEPACLEKIGNDYTGTISATKMPCAREKNADAVIDPVIDNELSLSPIGRFILLQ